MAKTLHELDVPTWVREVESTSPLRHFVHSRRGVRAMDAAAFRDVVREAYDCLFAQLDERGLHAVRFWTFLPGIHDRFEDGLTRYMTFNTARHSVFMARAADAAAFSASIPTASAVGIETDRFTVHCVGAVEKGIPVENPRQVPAYRYSEVYGPKPPCFARATALAGSFAAPMLLVAGTASITGERSRHEGEVAEQFFETVRNLAHLVANASGQLLTNDSQMEKARDLLSRFTHLRVYYVRRETESLLRRLVANYFPRRTSVEFAQVTLCRPELLVEIEGLATLFARP